jgi:hypothetical protein
MHMREVISTLMLSVDELWLTHAARIRENGAVTAQDIQIENILFDIEAVLAKSQGQLIPLTRNRVQPPGAVRTPPQRRSRRGKKTRSQSL